MQIANGLLYSASSHHWTKQLYAFKHIDVLYSNEVDFECETLTPYDCKHYFVSYFLLKTLYYCAYVDGQHFNLEFLSVPNEIHAVSVKILNTKSDMSLQFVTKFKQK